MHHDLLASQQRVSDGFSKFNQETRLSFGDSIKSFVFVYIKYVQSLLNHFNDIVYNQFSRPMPEIYTDFISFHLSNQGFSEKFIGAPEYTCGK